MFLLLALGVILNMQQSILLELLLEDLSIQLQLFTPLVLVDFASLFERFFYEQFRAEVRIDAETKWMNDVGKFSHKGLNGNNARVHLLFLGSSQYISCQVQKLKDL